MLAAVAAWQIATVQFNGLVADRVGLGLADLQAMYVLANHGAATSGELARRVNLTTGAASRMIDRLERAKFVRRVRDPRDRRRVLIEPLPEAVVRVSAFYENLNKRHRKDLSTLTEGELATLVRFLKVATISTETVMSKL